MKKLLIIWAVVLISAIACNRYVNATIDSLVIEMQHQGYTALTTSDLQPTDNSALAVQQAHQIPAAGHNLTTQDLQPAMGDDDTIMTTQSIQ